MDTLPRFHRTIEIDVPSNGNVSAHLEDPSHRMGFAARVVVQNRIPFLCDLVPDGVTSYPFAPCLEAIQAASPATWQDTDLSDPDEIDITFDEAEGCEHMAELVRFLGIAHRNGIVHWRLEMKAVFHEPCWNIQLDSSAVLADSQSEGPAPLSYSIQAMAVPNPQQRCIPVVEFSNDSLLNVELPADASELYHRLSPDSSEKSIAIGRSLILLLLQCRSPLLYATRYKDTPAIPGTPEQARQVAYRWMLETVRRGNQPHMACAVSDRLRAEAQPHEVQG